MDNDNKDWFISNQDSLDLGEIYEAEALKDHKYYVKVKSLHLLRKARELYGDTHKLCCVDLGCGTAETIEHFQDEFASIVGCDYSLGMLEYAAKKNLRNVTFKHCQSEKLPIDSNSVDMVLLYGIIHHIDSADKIINTFEEIRRILKVGGAVAVYDFNPLNPVSRHIVKTCSIDIGVHLDGYKLSKYPTTFYSWEIKSILQQAGFSITMHEYLLVFPKFLSLLLPLERLISRIPIGGMYSVIGLKS